MPLIVTGSSGLLGGAVISALQDDFQVVGFDRDGEPQPPHKVECICVDLTDEESVRRGLHRTAYAYGKRLAGVVHLAAYVNFDDPDSPLYEEVTVKGTRRLLHHLREMAFEVDRFIFSSTMLVHRPTGPGERINENSPLEGNWAYPRSKIDTELVVRDYAGGYPTAILRIAGVYTDEHAPPTIDEQIRRIAEHSPKAHVFPGDVRSGQAFVHRNDVIDAIRRVIDRRAKLPSHAVYLIGEPETYSYDRLQHAIARNLHEERQWTTVEVPKAAAKTGAWMETVAAKLPVIDEPFIQPWMVDMADDHYELDISRAREELGWEPKHRLIDSIPGLCRAQEKDTGSD
jgi:nucleoside-diphosphate-sugar epimerase